MALEKFSGKVNDPSLPLSAIARQRLGTTGQLSQKPAYNAPGVERGQLTVMFGDLADSPTLSQPLDPAGLHKGVRAYHATAAAVILIREVWKLREGRHAHNNDKLDRRHLAVLLSTYNSHEEVLCLLSCSSVRDKSCCHRCCGTLWWLQERDQLEVTIDGDRLVLTRVQSVPAQPWQRWRGRLAGTRELQAHMVDHADEVCRERLS
jgi:hypothetical protein